MLTRARPTRSREGASLEEAMLLVHWRFDALSDDRTGLTQRMELWGENAAAYVDGIRAGFERNLEPGMRRIAEAMARAASSLVARERTPRMHRLTECGGLHVEPILSTNVRLSASVGHIPGFSPCLLHALGRVGATELR
jgi:hypothetical protein